MNEQLIKRCTVCGYEFPATSEYFYEDRRCDPPRLRGACKSCLIKRDRASRDPDKMKQYNKLWVQKHRERCRANSHRWRYRNLEQQRARERAYKQRNPVQHQVDARRWRQAHPERVKQSRKQWGSNNRSKLITIYQRYITKKLGLPNAFSATDWQRAVAYFGGRCAVCGRPPGLWHTLAIDHWIPLSSDACPGTIPANIVPLCHGIDGCNNSKHNRDPEEWLIEKSGKRRAHQILSRIQDYFASLSD
jgi:hypothetical protein